MLTKLQQMQGSLGIGLSLSECRKKFGYMQGGLYIAVFEIIRAGKSLRNEYYTGLFGTTLCAIRN